MQSNRVKIARAIVNKDMREFAKEAGYSASLISRVESGDRKVSKRLSKYCEAIIKQFIRNERGV